MAVEHVVVKGDTLSEIAVRYGTTVRNLVTLNDLKDPDYIVVGQKLIISGTPAPKGTNTTYRANIDVFGLQSNTDRTVYVTWTWDQDNTENYEIKWYYDTGDNVWFIGTSTTTLDKQSIYTAPNNANRVKFMVKPISKSKTMLAKSATYWTADWSTAKIYSFSSNPPAVPPVPTVSISDYKLTARVDNLTTTATSIEFQIVKNDSSVFNTGKGNVSTNSAVYSCSIDSGSEYKVRCRGVKGSEYSEWSNYSSNVNTAPSTPSGLSICRASSETSVYLEWSEVQHAASYDIEYTTNKNYFSGSDQTTTVSGIEFTRYEKTGLTSGEEYFFRIRAVNSVGHSGWSKISSTVIGKNPAAPTTWSSTTTAVSGEPLNLYWVHNAEDGSSQTYAELELTINGEIETYTIRNSTDEAEIDKTSCYPIQTSGYKEGVQIQWRVRTAGITNVYGDWSVQRTVDIYAPPTLLLDVTNSNGEVLETLEQFPFYISGIAGPNTQMPIGYHLSVIANEAYETTDTIGNSKNVNAGEAVYSKYFDTSDPLLVELSARNIDLKNNISYTVVCSVSMDSGLTAESASSFVVAWTENQYEPNAEISIDKTTFTASIQPYCTDENGYAFGDILLSVYRREFDGNFTELARDLDNEAGTFITDPHPALDYARYRIVAASKTTGAVSFCDIPAYPVGGNAVIIQWDEEWTSFAVSDDADALEKPTWSGSMLVLPYNIDVSDNHKPDVALVEYIGRKRPVTYYGTQLGETSTWNVSIEKADKETLYALRRLSIWMGDVYVREPSGSGYWANITVSFGQKHNDVTIPVTIDVTRVEGGM